jgi:hypothetical protein
VRAIVLQNDRRTADKVVVFKYRCGTREVGTSGIHPLASLMAVVAGGGRSEGKVTFDQQKVLIRYFICFVKVASAPPRTTYTRNGQILIHGWCHSFPAQRGQSRSQFISIHSHIHNFRRRIIYS